MSILNGPIGKTIYIDKFDYKIILSQWFVIIVGLDEMKMKYAFISFTINDV
jgi:hypothetical protein